MRKTTLVLLVVLILALSVAAFAFQNEPEGFRGLKWGDPPGEDMKFLCVTPEGARWYIGYICLLETPTFLLGNA